MWHPQSNAKEAKFAATLGFIAAIIITYVRGFVCLFPHSAGKCFQITNVLMWVTDLSPACADSSRLALTYLYFSHLKGCSHQLTADRYQSSTYKCYITITVRTGRHPRLFYLQAGNQVSITYPREIFRGNSTKCLQLKWA